MPEIDHRRCRLCTTNDREGLIDELAAEMWDTHRDREIDPPWDKAEPYWHNAIRNYAAATVRLLAAKH